MSTQPFKYADAVATIVALIENKQLTLPASTAFTAVNPGRNGDDVHEEKARAQAKYLRTLLSELTKEDK